MKFVFRIILVLLIIAVSLTGYAILADRPDLNLFVKLDLMDSHADEEDDDDAEDDEDDDVPLRVEKVGGVTAIRLDLEQQQQSGLQYQRLESITLSPEEKAFATVIDIQPLLELRADYNKLNSEKNIALTALRNSESKLEHLRLLHKEAANISARQLQEAKADTETERARVRSIDIQLNDLASHIKQAWGSSMGELVLTGDSDLFQRFLNREEALLRLNLTADQTLPEGIDIIYVDRRGDRLKARQAYLLSAAPNTDPVSQGETYFLHTSAAKLRSGMRLTAWFRETAGQALNGVFIPDEAVIWYVGSPWAYVKMDGELFSRRILQSPIDAGDGWLVQAGFKKDENIVVSGAQMLLSEELRWQIPDEDDNP